MYSTVKGGEAAIAAAEALLRRRRRGDPAIPEIGVEQVREQMGLGVSRVMAEGGLYDPPAAAIALKQAQGDTVEAAYLLRAFRSTLARFAASKPLETGAMLVRRSLSTTHKSVPDGQILGPTYDYTHRLLDFSLLQEAELPEEPEAAMPPAASARTAATRDRDLIETLPDETDAAVYDLTRQPITLPASRDQRLQALARGDEGFLVGLAYSSFRNYGKNHPFLATLKEGFVDVLIDIPELGESACIGEISVTECVTFHKFVGSGDPEADPPRFTRGYALVLGHCERKAIAMAIVDRALRSRELGESHDYPVQDEEFVLTHADSIDASGMVQHIKLPHYVDFQAEILSVEELREAGRAKATPTSVPADEEALA